jgi:hypothetical protein
MSMRTLIAALAMLTTAAGTTLAVVVSPGNMNGWQVNTYDSSGNTPNASPGYSGTFVTGPAPAPLGTGSARLQVGVDGAGAVKLHTANFNGTPLSSITRLTYSTFVTTNSGGTSSDDQQAPYVQIPVDWDGNGTFDDRLFFEPVYQTGSYLMVPGAGAIPDQRGGDGAAPKLGIWETYDILAGGFWTANSMSGGPPLDTFAHYLTLHPNATIVNSSTALGFQLVAGFGGPGDWGQFDGNVDAVTFGTASGLVTYDFEPAAVPEASAMLFTGLAMCLAGAGYGLRRRKA